MASVARDPRLATNTWVVPRSLLDKVLTLGVWIAVTWLVYAASFPLTPPVAQLPYILFIVYFATLCLRMLTVPLWANNTIRLLERCSREPVGLPATCPQFLVFIAAYKAQESIQVVLEALRHQTYPADKFRVYVITQAAENFEKSAQFQDVSRRVRSAVHKGGRREETSHADLRVLAALIQRLPVPAGPSGPISVLLSHAIAGKLLQWTKPKLSRALAKLVLLQFLRADSEGRQLESASRDLASDGLTLRSTAVRLILQFVPRCTSIASQVIADFARILGLPPHISVFADPAKPWKLAATVAGDRVTTRLQSPILNLMLRRDLGNWLDGVSEIGETCRRTLMSLPDFEADLRKGYDAGVRTCPEAVEDALVRCGPNFHHICRKKVGGGKPESLNSAYFQLLEEEPELLGDDTFFVVIDADSLLCSSSLAVAAREIRSDPELNVVRQIAPISTSNYAGNNAFVKLVGCLDTLGSMGKWARSTRTLERPDLPAGSGLVIPAPLLEHLRRTRGSPWDGTTITEDARLVISDYGLLDGATQRTKFVPVHLLEAVPEGPTVLGVFKQYWAQRMRWASGGPDEIRQLLRAFRTDHLYVNTRSPDGRFQLRRRGRWERMLARSRHLWMLLRWTGDHFWWGPGYGLAPLVWLTFDFFYPTPRLFRIIGCSMLFGLPAWTLFGVFRRFAPFVPGGLQWQDLIRLYLTALLLALFLPWPVMHTHILYLLGRTSRFKGWAATPKPQY